MENKLLENKVCLVTGASRGIGLAIAQTFAKHGATVILNSRQPSSVDKLCADLASEYGVKCAPSYFDVTNPEAVKNGILASYKEFKKLDVLVNNAGILKDSLFAMSTSSTIHEVINTNLIGSLYCSQIASRLMARQGSGSLINISSIIGVEGNEGQVVYGASKAGVIGMTKSLAKELGEKQVRVNAIAPGFIDTDMIKDVPLSKRTEIEQNIKMGRLGSPTDIANTALFLAADLSTYVTGQVIGVDGGMMI